MASSSCPKCDFKFFEVVENEPANGKYKYVFTQCAKCGTVVGVNEFYNIGALIKETPDSLMNRLQSIEQRLQSIEYAIQSLNR